MSFDRVSMFFLVIFLIFTGSTSEIQAEERLWTSRSGATIQAAFVSESSGQVVLKRGDGELLRIELSQLSPEDQSHILSLEGGIGTGRPGAPVLDRPKAGMDDSRSSLSGGAPSGNKAFLSMVERPLYRLAVDRNGIISLALLKDGNVVGPPIKFGELFVNYQRSGRGSRKAREFVKVTVADSPSKNSDSIALRYDYEQGITVDLEITTAENLATISARLSQPAAVQDPTRIALRTTIPTTAKFPVTMEEGARKATVEGWALKLDRPKGVGESFTFWDSYPTSLGEAKAASISGAFAPYELKITGGDAKNPFRVVHYEGMPLYQGLQLLIDTERAGKAIVTAIQF